MAGALEPDEMLVGRCDAIHDMGRVGDIDRPVVAAVSDQRRGADPGQFSVDDAQQPHQALDADGRTAGVAVEQAQGAGIAEVDLVPAWYMPARHVLEPANHPEAPIAEVSR